jgi:pantothenate kinase-related protein Tda10
MIVDLQDATHTPNWDLANADIKLSKIWTVGFEPKTSEANRLLISYTN